MEGEFSFDILFLHPKAIMEKQLEIIRYLMICIFIMLLIFHAEKVWLTFACTKYGILGIAIVHSFSEFSKSLSFDFKHY